MNLAIEVIQHPYYDPENWFENWINTEAVKNTELHNNTSLNLFRISWQCLREQLTKLFTMYKHKSINKVKETIDNVYALFVRPSVTNYMWGGLVNRTCLTLHSASIYFVEILRENILLAYQIEKNNTKNKNAIYTFIIINQKLTDKYLLNYFSSFLLFNSWPFDFKRNPF